MSKPKVEQWMKDAAQEIGAAWWESDRKIAEIIAAHAPSQEAVEELVRAATVVVEFQSGIGIDELRAALAAMEKKG